MAEKKNEKLWSFSFQQVIQITIGIFIYFSCHSFPKHENMALFTSGPCVSAVRRTKALPDLLPCPSVPSEPKNHKEWKYNKVITGLLLLMKTHRKTNSLHSERQRDKYKINVQSTDEKIQILENKFLDRDIIYLKKINNCRRFFFQDFFPSSCQGRCRWSASKFLITIGIFDLITYLYLYMSKWNGLNSVGIYFPYL